MSIYDVQLSVTGISHEEWFIQVSPICLQVSRFHCFFFLPSSTPLCKCTSVSLSIHLLACFQVVAVTKNASMHIDKQMALLHECTSFAYGPKNGIARSCDSLIPVFLRNSPDDIWSGCTYLHSHQQWRSGPLSPHPLQHQLSFVFLI